MAEPQTLASHVYRAGELDAALEFLKRTRSELRALRKVRVWTDRLQVIDVNSDAFEIAGVGYTHPEIVAILNAVNAAYNRDTLHTPAPEPYKEFNTGRRYAWAQDRVM